MAKLWRLGLVLGNKEWRADWSPTRDELVRPAIHERHKRARTNRISKLDTAVQSFEKELAQRHAEALHGADATLDQRALALERVRAGNYSTPAGELILPARRRKARRPPRAPRAQK